jgi:hypothetical protein
MGGVGRNGTQLRSRAVAGFPSSGAGMNVIGRQLCQTYLLSKLAMYPSASAMFMSANIRAVFQMFFGWMATAVRARRFQPFALGSNQKRA